LIAFHNFPRKCKRYQRPIREALTRVLKRGWFILGPELREFEKAFARYLNVKHVIGVNSGTDAIFLALRALGIGASSEVITVANTAVPTISAIRMAGATPAFVDVLPDSQTLDPAQLESAINPRTRAIVPVHLYGYPARMREINRIAKKHKLFVIEDACQAHGAKYCGRMVGTLADAGCFSFYPTKNLGALGDSGAVATNNTKLANTLSALRNYGEVAKFNNVLEGVNSRLDEFQAALLNFGLQHIDEWNAQRAEIADAYFSAFKNTDLELPQKSDSVSQRIWHLFVVRTKKRNNLQRFLHDKGVETMIHYPKPIYRQRAYRFLGYNSKNLPVTTLLSNQILSLPMYPELTLTEVSRISSAVLDFYAASR
jgi:dTDP-4-amino-4,6-dideoxygalactose transaminase